MSKKNTVLIVDDEKDVCEAFAVLLEKFNCEVEYVTDEDNAIQKIKEKAYDIIFSDIFSSATTTFIKFIEHFARHENHNKKTPLVLMSGNDEKAFLEKIKEKEESIVYDYLIKPIDLVALLACLLSVNDRAIKKGLPGLDLPKPKKKTDPREAIKAIEATIDYMANNDSVNELKNLKPDEIIEEDAFKKLCEENKVDATVTNDKGLNALMIACLKGDKDVVKDLLEENTELLETVDPKGRRPINYAIAGNRKFVLKELLQKEVSLDIPDDEGIFPLQQAILLNKLDFVQILIDARCPLNLGKVNALMLAYKVQSKEIFKKLLFAGLKPEPVLRKVITDEEFLRILNKF